MSPTKMPTICLDLMKMMQLNEIILGDCLKIMPTMENDSVSITIISPPYNIGKSIHHGEDMYKGYKDNLPDDEYYQFIKKSLIEMIRVTRYYVFFNFAILTSNKLVFLDIISEFKPFIKEFFIWAKPNPAPGVTKGLCANGFEFILCLSKWDNEGRVFKRCFADQGRISNTLIVPTGKDFVEGHFACFGEWLPTFFIENFTEPNDIVADFFMGSGTTGVAAVRLGRQYLGCEINKEYKDFADKRIEKEKNQLKLFI